MSTMPVARHFLACAACATSWSFRAQTGLTTVQARPGHPARGSRLNGGERLCFCHVLLGLCSLRGASVCMVTSVIYWLRNNVHARTAQPPLLAPQQSVDAALGAAAAERGWRQVMVPRGSLCLLLNEGEGARWVCCSKWVGGADDQCMCLCL